MIKALLISLSLLLLAGCGGGGSSAFGGGDFAGLPSGGGTVIIPQGHNPEPTTLVLFGIGISGLAAHRLRKRRRQ